MNFESILFACGLAAEAAVILLQLRKRSFRRLPAFFFFVCWSFVSDPLIFAARLYFTPELFFRVYTVQLALDSVVMFAVLVELAWSLLLPIRSALPKHGWVAIGGAVALLALLMWPVAGLAQPAYLSLAGAVLFRLQQTFAILRVVFFLAMAGCSQLLSIGWRDRELQVATGLGAYSLVSLAVTILHTYQIVGSEYHWLDVLGGLSYMAVLIYWVVSFATKEAERRPFTPQMQEFLLAAAGAAHITRISIKSPANRRDRNDS